MTAVDEDLIFRLNASSLDSQTPLFDDYARVAILPSDVVDKNNPIKTAVHLDYEEHES